MNEQRPPGGIEWTRVLCSDGRVLRGYTWNVITGCKHACRWFKNTNGELFGRSKSNVAICYAEALAERFSQLYPNGFSDVNFHPNRLGQPKKLKEPSGIFLDSMSDAMGIGVEDDWVRQILDVCADTPQHVYQLLTKNAPRLLKFHYPDNVWVGVSSSPDYLMGKEMDGNRKKRYMSKALETLSRIEGASVRWISFEPLNEDYSDDLRRYPGVLDWAVVGATSDGHKMYPPILDDFQRTMDELDKQGIPVFFKGNMRSLAEAKMNWRNEFPKWEVRDESKDGYGSKHLFFD